MMKKNRSIIYQFIFIFSSVFLYSQETRIDTIRQKYKDIQEVIIYDKDYEKVDYSFALKQETDTKLLIGAGQSTYELGLKFKNNLEKKGIIKNITLFLHDTDKKFKLVDLEINIYKIDSLTEKPLEKLNNQKIVYTPKNRNKENVKINIQDYHIPFPKEGVLVSVKWLGNIGDKKIGPAIRLTNYEENLTYARFSESKEWERIPSLSKDKSSFTNVMIGLEVYVKKRKSDNE